MEESEPWGRSACSRVNRAVQNVTMSAVLLEFMALKGAPGCDEPASGDDGKSTPSMLMCTNKGEGGHGCESVIANADMREVDPSCADTHKWW